MLGLASCEVANPKRVRLGGQQCAPPPQPSRGGFWWPRSARATVGFGGRWWQETWAPLPALPPACASPWQWLWGLSAGCCPPLLDDKQGSKNIFHSYRFSCWARITSAAITSFLRKAGNGSRSRPLEWHGHGWPQMSTVPNWCCPELPGLSRSVVGCLCPHYSRVISCTTSPLRRGGLSFSTETTKKNSAGKPLFLPQ